MQVFWVCSLQFFGLGFQGLQSVIGVFGFTGSGCGLRVCSVGFRVSG